MPKLCRTTQRPNLHILELSQCRFPSFRRRSLTRQPVRRGQFGFARLALFDLELFEGGFFGLTGEFVGVREVEFECFRGEAFGSSGCYRTRRQGYCNVVRSWDSPSSPFPVAFSFSLSAPEVRWSLREARPNCPRSKSRKTRSRAA
jgi:hypothetical protein